MIYCSKNCEQEAIDLDKINASLNEKDEIILKLKEEIKECQNPLFAEISKLKDELKNQKKDRKKSQSGKVADLKIHDQSKHLETLREEISELQQQKEVLEEKMSNAEKECCKF